MRRPTISIRSFALSVLLVLLAAGGGEIARAGGGEIARAGCGVLSGAAFAAAPPPAAGDRPLYDPGIADLIDSARFPDACAVVLADRRAHTWSFDKTVIERSRALKILTREGIDRFGDFISNTYNRGIFDYVVEAAVVSPRGERNAVRFDRFRRIEFGKNEYQYRMAFPGLEIGSIIETAERLESKYSITNGRWDFACRVPTLRSELVFTVPQGVRARFSFTPKQCLPSPSPTMDGRFDTYAITAEVVPPYLDEPYMPRRFAGNPTIFYHVWQVTMEDYLRFRNIEYDDRFIEWMATHEFPWELPLGTRSWREIAGTLEEYFDPKTWEKDKRSGDYRAALSSIVGELPDEYTGDTARDLDVLLDDFHRRFTAIEVDFLHLNPERSFDAREGSPFELAYLLKRILEERGIECSIVVASDATGEMLDERVPDPYALSRPLLLVGSGDGRCWVDPADPVCGVNQLSWRYQGVKALWLKMSKLFAFIQTPLDAAAVNRAARRERLEIDSMGRLASDARITLTGQQMLEARREHLSGSVPPSEEEVREFAALFLPEGAAIETAALERAMRDTVTVSCRYSMERFGGATGDVLNLDLSGWWRNPVGEAFESDRREHEIIFPYPSTQALELEIGIPPGYSVRHQPPDVKEKDEWFSYARSCRRVGETLTFERNFTVTAPGVDAEAYEKAKKAIRNIEKHDSETIVLKRGA